MRERGGGKESKAFEMKSLPAISGEQGSSSRIELVKRRFGGIIRQILVSLFPRLPPATHICFQTNSKTR